MAGIFDKTKTASAPVPKKAKRGDTEHVKLPGLELYARVDALQKALTTVAETLCNELKATSRDVFIGQGIQFGQRPPNFKAVEGSANASVQLKAYAWPLTAEAQEQLREADIPLREDDKVAETFILNPEHASDEKIMATLEKALEPLIKAGKLPQDLFQHQSQKVVKVDGDVTLGAIFRLKNKKGQPDRVRIETLLPLVTSLAIKPTISESLDETLKNVKEVLDVTEGV